MRILSISHSAVVAGYHDRYNEIVRPGTVDLTVLVPKKWRQFNRWVTLGKTSDPHYRIIACQPICWGLRAHGLRNVTHVYPGMKKLLKDVRPEIIELWEEPFSAVAAHTIRAAEKIVPEAKIIFFSAQNLRKSYPPPFSWFEKYSYRNADFAFVMNEEAREVIREKGWKKESLVLPLGVNPETFNKLDASKIKRKLALDNFTAGFIGKFNRQKGVLDLIKAWAKLPGKVNLLMIGRGPLEADIWELLGEVGMVDAIKIIPPVPHKELPLYLNCMDVLVLPSITLPGLKEQFGRVLIEAMACQVPVIGSSSGEIPRVIDDAGLIFPEGDIDALAAEIDLLMKEPGRAGEYARKGRRRVEEKFTWSVIARKQVEVYHQLLSRN